MSWEDDDVHLGSFSEIGESLRGMQETNVGAAQALKQISTLEEDREPALQAKR